MSFTPPPVAPQRGDRTTFSGRVDAFLTWLVNLIPQLAVFESNLTALSAGGANAFPFVFDGGTADSDPGNGRLRFDGPSQSAATVMRIDTLTSGGVSILPLVTALLAGTSNIKASIRVQKVSDTSAWLIFDVTGATAASGYANLTGSVRISSRAGNLFGPDDSLQVFIEPRGDKGDGGGTPTSQQIRDAVGVLGYANGGTAATTPATALSNLGGLARTGGSMTGNITFDNSHGIFGADFQGNIRQIVKLDADNNVNAVVGPSGWNFYNAAATTVVLRLDNSGNLTPYGNIVMRNAVGIQMVDAGGTPRNVSYIGADNWLNFFGAPSGTRWFNAAANIQIAALTDSGNFSAVTVTEVSDERKKKNWHVLTDAQLDALAELEKVGVFDWIDGTGSAVGASAQQIRAIVPEAVHEDSDGNLSVAYGGLAFAMAQGALRRAVRP